MKNMLTHMAALCAVLLLAGMNTVFAAPDSDETESAWNQTAMTLQEYLNETDEQWFLTGKKEYTIQAMMVSGEFSFHNDLEGTDYTVTDDGHTVVLKGTVGEMWPTGIEKVMSSYTKPDGSRIGKDDFTPRNESIDITSIPDSGSRYAMHVPVNVSVTVETPSGDILHTSLPDVPHGDGDFLVCEITEEGTPDLTDIWVVNGSVFPNTYDTGRYHTDMEQTECFAENSPFFEEDAYDLSYELSEFIKIIEAYLRAGRISGLSVQPEKLNMLVSLDGEEDDYYEELTLWYEGKRADSKEAVWRSDHPEIAEVDEYGWVTSNGVGTAVITAQYNGASAECVIDVERKITSDTLGE